MRILTFVFIMLSLVSNYCICQSEGEWRTLITFSGTSSQNTDDFTIKSNKWRIIWEANRQNEEIYGGNFALYLIDANDNEDLITATMPDNDGTTIIRKKGTFYFKISALFCKWKVEIQEFKFSKKK